MTTATLPSGTGIVSSYSYDNADRLTGISHVQNGSTTVASVSYSLDNVGNRTQRVDPQGTHSYSYDNLYRLTSVTYPGPSTTSYTFDAFGNRTSMTDGSGTTNYAYDDADRITSVTPPSPAPAVSYTWDNNGNLTNRGSDTFSWDYEDRMTSATVSGVTTSFAYRGDGLRNSRTAGGATTTFTWDIGAGLPVVLDDGNQYVYGAGLTAMKQSGSWYYYLADGLGSTMAVVDASGAIQKSYTYDVYGKPTATGALANEFDFAGQQTDSTGLQYLRARYYDPDTGVFLSRDPLAGLPSWNSNPGSYATGSPVRWRDPLGLCRNLMPLCWGTVDPAVLGLTIDDSSHFFEALFVGRIQLPFYRSCESHPNGTKTCGPVASESVWLKWIYNNVPMAIGVTNAVMHAAEYILEHGKTPWNQGSRGTYDNDGRANTQRLPTEDINGNKINYTEWNAVQRNEALNDGTERIVTGSDGSAWYTDNHYQTFTRLK